MYYTNEYTLFLFILDKLKTTHYNTKYKPFIIYNVLTKYDVWNNDNSYSLIIPNIGFNQFT